MYYAEPKRKEEFTRKYTHQKKIYQQFVTVLKALIPIVAGYDGKVVNVKLIREFKEVVGDLFISLNGCEISISTDTLARCYENVQGNWSQVDVIRYTFNLSIDENKRLNSESTIATINEEINYLTSEIAFILTDISTMYDLEVEAYLKIKAAIQDYQKSFSDRLKRYIRIDY